MNSNATPTPVTSTNHGGSDQPKESYLAHGSTLSVTVGIIGAPTTTGSQLNDNAAGGGGTGVVGGSDPLSEGGGAVGGSGPVVSAEVEVRRALDQYRLLQAEMQYQPQPGPQFTDGLYHPQPATVTSVYGGGGGGGGGSSADGSAGVHDEEVMMMAAEANMHDLQDLPEDSADVRATKRAKRNEWDRERRKNETEEQRQARLERRRLAQWKKLSEEPYDKIQQKKDRRNALERERRKNETPAERLERLARRKEYERNRRIQESSDDATGTGSGGRPYRPRLARKKVAVPTGTSSNNSATQVHQLSDQIMSAAMPPLNVVFQQQQNQSLQFSASSISQQQEQHHYFDLNNNNMNHDPSAGAAAASTSTAGGGAGMSAGSAAGSDCSDSAHRLDHRVKRNEAERNRRMHETEEERAIRRAKRNEMDRRRYRMRKECIRASTGGRGSGGGSSSSGGGGVQDQQHLLQLLGGGSSETSVQQPLQMIPPGLTHGVDEEAILESVGQVFQV